MRKMGGLAKKIPHTYRTMLIGSIAIAGHPAAGRLLQQGRDPRRGVQARLPVGLGDRHRRRDHDRVLHVPADRADVLGREPRRPGGRAAHPRVAAGDDDVPLWLLAIPSVFLGLVLSWPGPPLGPLFGSRARACSPAGSSRSSRTARASSAAPRRRSSSSASTARCSARASRSRSIGDRRRVAAVRRRARPIRLAGRPGARPDADRPRPVPLPRLAEQVVVRRPQPPAVHRHRRPGRRRSCGGSTGASSTTP